MTKCVRVSDQCRGDTGHCWKAVSDRAQSFRVFEAGAAFDICGMEDRGAWQQSGKLVESDRNLVGDSGISKRPWAKSQTQKVSEKSKDKLRDVRCPSDISNQGEDCMSDSSLAAQVADLVVSCPETLKGIDTQDVSSAAVPVSAWSIPSSVNSNSSEKIKFEDDTAKSWAAWSKLPSDNQISFSVSDDSSCWQGFRALSIDSSWTSTSPSSTNNQDTPPFTSENDISTTLFESLPALPLASSSSVMAASISDYSQNFFPNRPSLSLYSTKFVESNTSPTCDSPMAWSTETGAKKSPPGAHILKLAQSLKSTVPSRHVIIQSTESAFDSRQAELVAATLRRFGDVASLRNDFIQVGFIFCTFYEFNSAVAATQMWNESTGVSVHPSEIHFSQPFEACHERNSATVSIQLTKIAQQTVTCHDIGQFCSQYGAVSIVVQNESYSSKYFVEYNDARNVDQAIRQLNASHYCNGSVIASRAASIHQSPIKIEAFTTCVSQFHAEFVTKSIPIESTSLHVYSQDDPSVIDHLAFDSTNCRSVTNDDSALHRTFLLTSQDPVLLTDHTSFGHMRRSTISSCNESELRASNTQQTEWSNSFAVCPDVPEKSRYPVPTTCLPAIPRHQTIANANSEYSLSIDKLIAGEDRRTTLMIRNIPNKYTQHMLLDEINCHHHGQYDFFYLPIDFKNKCNMGYAFINFVRAQAIVPFYKEFNHQKWNKFNSEKVCAITYARLQGKKAMITRFQNSSLLDKQESYRPLVFVSSGPNRGQPEPFPNQMKQMAFHPHAFYDPAPAVSSLNYSQYPIPSPITRPTSRSMSAACLAHSHMDQDTLNYAQHPASNSSYESYIGLRRACAPHHTAVGNEYVYLPYERAPLLYKGPVRTEHGDDHIAYQYQRFPPQFPTTAAHLHSRDVFLNSSYFLKHPNQVSSYSEMSF